MQSAVIRRSQSVIGWGESFLLHYTHIVRLSVVTCTSWANLYRWVSWNYLSMRRNCRQWTSLLLFFAAIVKLATPSCGISLCESSSASEDSLALNWIFIVNRRLSTTNKFTVARINSPSLSLTHNFNYFHHLAEWFFGLSSGPFWWANMRRREKKVITCHSVSQSVTSGSLNSPHSRQTESEKKASYQCPDDVAPSSLA